MSQPPFHALQLSYFGKLAAHADFVKGVYNPQLLRALDLWVSQAMELLAEDPRWKLIYDEAAPLHFVCLGSRNRLAIAGHLHPSRDASARRFPFLVAVPLEVANASDFMVGAPMLVHRWWNRAAQRVGDLVVSAEPDLKGLETAAPSIDLAFKGSVAHAAYVDFLHQTSLLRMEQMLGFDGHRVSLRRLMLALGLLLQPVMGNAASQLEKGLSLPLPRDPLQKPLVATLWLDLVARFFAKADAELVVCVAQVEGLQRLVIGFNGLSPKTLLGVLHPQAGTEQNINIDQPEWVEDSVHSNHAMYKFVSYLDQPQLPLDIVIAAFREAFIGE